MYKMSSVLTAPDQIDRRVGYFLVTTAMTTGQSSTENFVTLNSVETLTAVMTPADFSNATTYAALGQNVVLRDMGKQVVVNDGGLNTQVWRRVQVVNGSGSEGVPSGFASAADFFVLTWSADPTTAVSVVRTG